MQLYYTEAEGARGEHPPIAVGRLGEYPRNLFASTGDSAGWKGWQPKIPLVSGRPSTDLK